MRNATWQQRTVLQTHAPANGDQFTPIVTLDGITLPQDSAVLMIDGERWWVCGRRSDIDTKMRTVVTVLTVIKDD